MNWVGASEAYRQMTANKVQSHPPTCSHTERWCYCWVSHIRYQAPKELSGTQEVLPAASRHVRAKRAERQREEGWWGHWALGSSLADSHPRAGAGGGGRGSRPTCPLNVLWSTNIANHTSHPWHSHWLMLPGASAIPLTPCDASHKAGHISQGGSLTSVSPQRALAQTPVHVGLEPVVKLLCFLLFKWTPGLTQDLLSS